MHPYHNIFDSFHLESASSNYRLKWRSPLNLIKFYDNLKRGTEISFFEEAKKDVALKFCEACFGFRFGLTIFRTINSLLSFLVMLNILLGILSNRWKLMIVSEAESTGKMVVNLMNSVWNLYVSFVIFTVHIFQFLGQLEQRWISLGIYHEPMIIAKIMQGKRLNSIGVNAMLLSYTVHILLSAAGLVNSQDIPTIILGVIYYLLIFLSSLIYFSTVYQLFLECIFVQAIVKYLTFKLQNCQRVRNGDLVMMKNYRKIFTSTIDMILSADSFWATYIFGYYTLIVPINVTILFNIFYVDCTKLEYCAFTTLLICSGVSLAMITWAASCINYSVGKMYQDVYRLTLGQKPLDFLIEARLFLDRIDGDDIGFTIGNIVTIRPNIVSTVSTALLTLLIALPSFMNS
ncbi:uncharacterized protein LOC141851340 [Brevipalpus obovatus]|uniref:uncharacterized protein LOC141851340 n=1 Tax=Brevipalpus obovatus TaxID=246614 RepID=UPI003D9DCCCB